MLCAFFFAKIIPIPFFIYSLILEGYQKNLTFFFISSFSLLPKVQNHFYLPVTLLLDSPQKL
jgi:hypothetical protein